MEESLSLKRSIIKYQDTQLLETEDEIVIEFPLTIMINGQEFATMVCSPFHLEELVIGFLASEGVIRFRKEIKDFKLDIGAGFAHIELIQDKFVSQQTFSKRFIGSCCGKSRQFYFQNDVRTAKTSMSKTKITAEQCIQLMKKMQSESIVFKQTGGVHNAALCSSDELIVSRTDIGRHNALDKLFGYSLLNQISVKDKILVFSGRISSEILTKAAKIGVGIVLSKSAPTDLAIKLAEDLNITAVGFIRNGSFNIYSHPERIILENNEEESK
ncbi:formate dehydrogenase subunit D [Alkalihalobacillus alcalophilus ATCC 27647 = CGMCC 1.3604]|uniref:Sulfur carrier protein FdhD n=1 Tax=Alkalihalobacillus alcalophilus ATCC 27647 = CGMCC 1.3604 TaxID=1218173 RepID=A0A094YSD3_ALKAL|nr:formate dehydrogenase accessory sulfurtransferase FdhD [Alkalihalobacillus alcalophilus]KGA96392.1 formate dehydrogenase [Alkalihalobacillus alcalophilus ATCC 27647 = CGMCC 1.3604]MED1563218.1 formate dehydrogenase accessory sulfurtransferase FdhD [Alkalihalobacillus alcalophilus]THG90001.1 formate dehydrogenase subunit D [Alkalihalobacillus alcalophilus ATCC 27647 = CGMCC 1.3604]